MSRRIASALAFLLACCVPAWAAQHAGDRKLDRDLLARAHAPRGESRVIIQTTDGAPASDLIGSLGGRPGRHLRALRGQVARIQDSALDDLAASARVESVSLDRHVRGTMERTGTTVGATWVREQLGVDGSGIGIAIIDSGVTTWHDDLGSERVVHFADFVGYQASPYDDYGHGTHVAGIIAGNGYDSDGARRGIAPGASLVVLKVLDASGDGYISNVIAAIDYAVEQRTRFNIRVINLSVAAGVHQSFTTDPLTLAARRAVEAGIVVVTAAGNFGRDAKGQLQYGGITAPGNAPWVLTVGATTHNGTVFRGDDTVAPFSSRGPTRIDRAAKPDLVAPGVGIESLADNSSALYAAHPSARLWGTLDTSTPPYLSLTGTSMAAPVVAGTIALMLQAHPTLTPNLVKAVLQYTAEDRAKFDSLTEGAGFLNARGAVQLAQSLSAGPGAASVKDDPTPWSRHIIWGNRRMGGAIKPDASAWRPDVMWGSVTRDGRAVAAAASCADPGCAAPGPGTEPRQPDIVWGSSCDGPDCVPVLLPDTPCDGQDPDCVGDGPTTGGEPDAIRSASCETYLPSCDDVVWPASDGHPVMAGRSRTVPIFQQVPADTYGGDTCADPRARGQRRVGRLTR